MTAMIIIITIIIPTLSATLCVCAWFIWICVCVHRHVALKILYARLRKVFMNLVHLHGV